jgi:hypothetical protein
MQSKSHEDWDWLINLKSRGYDFNFVELSCGPNVHIDFSDVTRNKSPATPLDYLSIYRKWPALDELIRDARAQKLASMGISIEAKFL